MRRVENNNEASSGTVEDFSEREQLLKTMIEEVDSKNFQERLKKEETK